jgi:hypothetical protein
MRLPGQRRDLQQLAGRLYARLFTYAAQKPQSQHNRRPNYTSGGDLTPSDSSPESPHYPISTGATTAATVSRPDDRHSYPVARTRRLKPSLRSRAPTTGPVVSAVQPAVRLTFEDQLQLARVKKLNAAAAAAAAAAGSGAPNPVSASHPHLPPTCSTPRLSTSASAVHITNSNQPVGPDSHHTHHHHPITMPSSGKSFSLSLSLSFSIKHTVRSSPIMNRNQQ